MGNSSELSPKAIATIGDPETLVFVSAASIWEIEIKRGLGKLKAPHDVAGALQRHQFTELPIRISHARATAALPDVHRDPFDRMLAAQAKVEGLTLVTRDARLKKYGIQTLQL